MKVYKFLSVVLALVVLLSAACSGAAPVAQVAAPTQAPAAAQPTLAPAAPPTEAAAAAPSGKKLRLGLVMHFQSPFNDQIAAGAKDAAKDFGLDLDVVAPPAFDAQTAIGMFEALLQKKDDGIAVIAYPSDVWVAPINKAMDAGVPIVTTNVSAPDSKAPLWVGQDEFNSGRLLAQEIFKDLNGKTGKIVLGTCAPGLNVIDARGDGFKDVMKDHPDIKVLGPFDVGGEPSANYAAWQNQLSANPDAVAMVGLCANDLPNLAKLSQKTGTKFVAGGYDLQPDALTGIKNGFVNAAIGQNPYLEGYLPIMALAKKLQNNVELPKGWVNSGTEVVNASNIDETMTREANAQATSDYYHKLINEQYKDLNSVAKPMPGSAPAAAAAPSGKKLRLGLVMHFQSPFNDQIAAGAKDAAKDFGLDLDVVAPPAFDAQTAIGMFEALLQKKDDGIAVIAYPSDVWVAPINKAMDAGVPIVTTNVSAPDSKAPLWVGQDEFNSGRLLAQEIFKDLNGKTGKIVLGTCAPGLNVIDARGDGFKDVMKDHPDIKVLGPFDVGGEPSANYAAWQNQLSANPDAVAMVGLCANDLPNLAKLSQKTGTKFVAGGYDLQPDALTGIKNGFVNAAIGQNPYLEGYLPIMALAKKLQNNVELPKGWVNSGTEVVNSSNIDETMTREANAQATSDYYHKLINEQYKDLNSVAKPMPSN